MNLPTRRPLLMVVDDEPEVLQSVYDLFRLDYKVLKFERGSFIDDATRNLYVMRGDHAVRVPVELGASSVAEVEVVRGLNAGDRVIVSDMRDFNDEPEVTVTR